MNHGKYLMLIIGVVLLLSLTIPSSTYSPPALPHDKRPTEDIYAKGYTHSAVVLCRIRHSNYFQYVVNRTLNYPHYYVYSPMTGLLETDILVKNWTSFKMPYNCELLSWEDIKPSSETDNSVLVSALRKVLNSTKNPDDRELLERLIKSSSYEHAGDRPSTNSTLVHVEIMTSDVYESVGTPFVLVWTLVMLLSIAGAVVSKNNRVLLAGFIALLVLGMVFVGKYAINEEKEAGREKAFEALMSLKTTNSNCGVFVGVVNAPPTPEGISEVLTAVNRTNASISHIEFRDDYLLVDIGIKPENAPSFLEEFSKKGWDVSSELGIISEKERALSAGINRTRRMVMILENSMDKLLPLNKRR